MYRDRLEHVARKVLPFVHPENFDMGTWKCGTVACACGHAALHPFHRNRGFGLRFLSEDSAVLIFGGVSAFDAIAEYFDISHHDAVELFMGDDLDAGDSPAYVAAKIEDYLAATA